MTSQVFSVSWGFSFLFNHPEIWGFIYSALLYNSNDYAHDSGQVVGAQREKKACSQGHPSFGQEGSPVSLPYCCCHFQESPSSQFECPDSLCPHWCSLQSCRLPRGLSKNTKGIFTASLMVLWTLVFFPNWPATLLFKEFSNSCSCILSRCYCCFTGR